MNKCPQIGDRVSYPGGVAVGPCTGTITAIYPKYEWDEERDRTTNIALPEREWRVAMKPDVLPVLWAYVGNDKFSPQVSELTNVSGAGVAR